MLMMIDDADGAQIMRITNNISSDDDMHFTARLYSSTLWCRSIINIETNGLIKYGQIVSKIIPRIHISYSNCIITSNSN